MMADERLFSVAEADAALPELRERMARIREARQVLIRQAEVVREKVVADAGGADPGPEYREASATLRTELERTAPTAVTAVPSSPTLADQEHDA